MQDVAAKASWPLPLRKLAPALWSANDRPGLLARFVHCEESLITC